MTTQEDVIVLAKVPGMKKDSLKREFIRMMLFQCKPQIQIKGFDVFLTKCEVFEKEDRFYLMAILSVMWYLKTDHFDFCIPLTQENLIAICATSIFEKEGLRYGLLADAIQRKQITPPLKDHEFKSLLEKCNIKASDHVEQLLLRHMIYACQACKHIDPQVVTWGTMIGFAESVKSTTKTVDPPFIPSEDEKNSTKEPVIPMSLDDDIPPKVYRYHIELEGRPSIDVEYTDTDFGGFLLHIDHLPSGEQVVFNKDGTYKLIA